VRVIAETNLRTPGMETGSASGPEPEPKPKPKPASVPPRKPLFGEFLLFILLPLIFLRFAGHYVVDQDAEFQRTAALTKLSGKLGKITHEGDTRNFFARLGADFTAAIRSEPMTSERILALWKASIADFGIEFELYCFDASGSLLTPNVLPLKGRELVEMAWKVFQRQMKNEDYFLRQKMQAMFGNDFEFEILKANKGISFPNCGNSGNGFLYWDSLSDDRKDGVLLALWKFPGPEVFLKQVFSACPEPGLFLCGVDPNGIRNFSKKGGTRPLRLAK